MKNTLRFLLMMLLACCPWVARTQCAPGVQTIPLTIQCHDSYGDGWNGCALVVHQSGSVIETITLNSGNNGEFVVDVCLNGDSVYFTWIEGYWTNEVSFLIVDAGNNVLYTGNGMNHQNGDTLYAVFPTVVNCYFPSSLTATAIAATSVTLAWEDPYNSDATYAVNLIAEGDSVPTYQQAGITSHNTTFTGLLPSTAYTATLRAHCSPNDSTSQRTYSFHTLCNTVMQLPFIETWDSLVDNNPWSHCWSLHHTERNSFSYEYFRISYTDAHSEYNQVLEMCSDIDTIVLVSAPITLTGQHIDVTFWLRQFSGWMKAGLATSTDISASFIPLMEINNPDYLWHEYYFNSLGLDSTATYYLVLMGCGNYNNYISSFAQFDDIHVEQHNPCGRPQTTWVDNIDYYSAQLHWTAVDGAAGYVVRYGTSLEQTDSVVVTDTVVTINGLSPNSIYYASVSTLCGNGESLPVWFTNIYTPVSCAPPFSVSLDDVGPTAARISWQYNNAQEYFPSSGILLALHNNTTGARTNYTATGNSLLITNLDPATSYSVYLTTVCATIGDRVDTSQTTGFWFNTPDGDTTCFAPMVELATTGTLVPTLQWPSLGTAGTYLPRYRLVGTDTFTLLPPVNDTLFAFTALQPSSYYSLSVGSLCGQDTLWSREIDVTTACAGITFPWSEDFENIPVGHLPSCWTPSPISDNPQNIQVLFRDGSNHALVLNGPGTLVTFTEAIPIVGDSIEIKFRAYRDFNGSFQVGLIGNPNDTSTFIPLSYIDYWNWHSYRCYFTNLDPNTTYHFAIYYNNNGGWGEGYIDDIHIKADHGCRFPVNYTQWNDSTHATVIWYTYGSATDYLVRYRHQNDTLWQYSTATPDSTGLLEYNLSGLQASSFYYIECGAPCGEDTLWCSSNLWTTSTCPRIADVWVADSTFSSITLAWHPLPDHNSGFQIQFGDNFWYPYDTTITFTNLEENHEYTFRLAAYCPNNGYYSEPVEFTAHTSAYPTLEQYPYCTSFDNEADNQDWILLNGSNNQWHIGTATGYGDTHSLYISMDGNISNTYSTYASAFSYAIRQLSVTGGDYVISFKWRAYGESSYDYLRAWIAPNNAIPTPGHTPDGSTSSYYYQTTTPDGWIDLGGRMNLNDEWTSVYTPLHLDSGTYRLIFMWANDGSAGAQPPAAIDNLCIKHYTCPAVASVNTQTIGIHNTILQWTDTMQADGVSYSIVDANENVIGTTTGTTFNITSLDAMTQYSFGVVRQCSANNIAYPVYTTFTTHCETVPLPYYHDFENDETYTLPTCWQRKSANSNYPEVYSYNGFQNTQSLRFYCSTSSEDSMMAILPEIDLQGQSMTGNQLVFISRMSYSNQLTMQVGTMSDPDNPATFVADSILVITDAGEMEHMIPLAVHSPATNTHVAIMVQRPENSNYLYLDNMMVDVIPNCQRPAGLGLWNTYADSLILSWEAGTADSWEIEVSNDDTTILFSATVPAVSIDNYGIARYTVRNLQPYTLYHIRMRAVCGNEYSYWPLYPTDMSTLNNETNITSFVLTNLEREAAIIDTDAHTVTVPIYYSDNLTNEEGSYTLSDGAWMQVLDDAGMWNNVNELRDLLRHAWQNVPLTVRVYAQDSKYFTIWTFLFVGEACSRVSQLKAQPERLALNLTWEETDPAAGSFQLVVSPTTLSSDALEVAQKTLVNQKAFRVEGLERNTTYYVYVRSDCGYCLSGWTLLEAKTLDLIMCGDTVIGDSLSTTTSYHTPLNNFYNYTLTQTLLYANELEGLVSIEGISYYYDYNQPATVKEDVDIWLQPTGKTSFVASNDVEVLDTNSAVLVYSGPMNYPQGWNSVVFNEPYSYEGGNLLVIVDDNSGHYNGSSYVFRTSPTEDYSTLEWYSDSYNPDPTNPGAYSGSKAYYRYRALMRVYGCSRTEACPAVDTVTVDNIGTTEATVQWTPSEADYLNHYEVAVSPTLVEDLDTWNGPLAYSGTALSCTLTNLAPYTDYYVYVRANCVNNDRDEGTSTWQMVYFKTFSECRTAADVAARISGKHEAVVSWRNQGTMANYEYVLSPTALTDSQLESASLTGSGINDTSVTLTALASEQTYYFYIRNNCGSDVSPWTSTSLTTYEAMPAVVELRADGVGYNALTAVWQRDVEHYADETAWRVALSLDGVEPTEWSTVYDLSHVFYGLMADTNYRIYVAAYDVASNATSDTVDLVVRTLTLPEDCAVVSTGETVNNHVPLYGNYTDNHQRIQSVYPAEMLLSLLGRTVTSMSYFVSSGSSSGWNDAQWEVSLGVTPATDVAAGWADTAVLTRVYTGTLTASVDEGMTVLFDEPFVYTGGNLLVQFVERQGHSSYSDCAFRGGTVTGASRYAYPSNGSDLMSAPGSVQDFLPQVQFCYLHAGDCYSVSRAFFTNTTAHTTDVMWYLGNEESEWQWALDSGQWVTTNVNQLTLMGLESESDYQFSVRPVCGAGDTGMWSTFRFTTLPSCGLPDTLWADDVTATSAVLHAAGVTLGSPQSYTFRYWPLWGGDTLSVTTEADSVVVTGLMGNTDYVFDVQVHCGDVDGDSRWTLPSGFHTPCGSVALPFYHHFSWDNTCWTMVSDNSANQVKVVNFCAGTGVRFSSTNTLRSGTYNQYVFSPVLDHQQGTPQKVVIEYSTMGSNNRLWIGYTMEENTIDPADYTWSNTYFTSTGECDIRQAQLLLPAGVKRMAVRYYGTHADYAYLISVNITDAVSYTLNVVVDSTKGIYEGPSGTLYEGTDVTLNVTPKYGYRFYNWSYTWGGVLSQENPYSFTLGGDMSVEALFIINKYNVTAVSSNTTMGTVTGGGRVDYLTPMTLSATANYGYHFSHWSNGDSIPTITLNADSNMTLVAYFDYNRYAVVGSSADAARGSVIGSDTVNFLTEVTLSAVPNYGYHFTGWSNGDTSRTLTITAVENRSLTANFAPNPYAVTALSGNTVMGTVNGSATVDYLSSVTLTATANYGYHFVGWSNGESNPSITVTALCDTVLTALFDYNNYSVTATSGDTVMGSVSGSATVRYLDTITLVATPRYGYHFTSWSNGVTTDTLRMQVTADMNLMANFTYNQYTVSGTTATPDRGSVIGTATVNYLSPVSLNATPYYGYRFMGWAGDIDSNDVMAMPMTVIADRNRTVVATFDTIAYNVTANINHAEMGSVSGADSTRHFATAHLIATANYGYHFVNWTNAAGNVLGVNTSISISPVSDTAVIANFDYNQYTISGSANDATMGSVNGSATANYLDSVTLTAVAGVCYHFTGWSNGDTAAVITLPVLHDSAVVANFAVNVYNGSQQLTVCDSYIWNGQSLSQSGVYQQVLPTVNGCDSTATLDLTVNYSTQSVDSMTVCESYTWHDSVYTVSGTPTFDTVNAVGCDSTATLLLVVNYSGQGSESITACDGYDWKGQHYNQSGAYTFDTLTTAGCDSTVTLHLTVNYSTQGDTTATACDSFTWHDVTFTSGTDTSTYLTTNVAGCDSTVTLHLTVNYSTQGDTTATACDSFTWHDVTFTSGTDTSTYLTTNVAGCDSTVTLHLTINYSTVDTVEVSATGSYEWQGNTFGESGTYIDSLLTVSGCDSILVLQLTILEGIAEVESNEVIIYPNPTKGRVRVAAEGVTRIEVYNVNGQLVNTVSGSTEVDLSKLPAGVYTMRVRTHRTTFVRRVIKE